MENGKLKVFCGTGKGKTSLALGNAVAKAAEGKSVIIIQYLKGREHHDLDFLEHMDGMDIKIFRFEKHGRYYEELSPEEKEEENINIINGVNYARKVISSQECDLLVLDEFLGLFGLGLVTREMFEELLAHKGSGMEIIMTGWEMPEFMKNQVDMVTTLTTDELTHE